MKQIIIFRIIAALCALIAASALGIYMFAAPTPLRVAVGPVGSEDTKLVVTILQTLQREKHSVRLRLVPSDGPLGSADMLRDGKADLAMVRSDGNIPPNAATVAIMHRDVVVILARPESGIKSIIDLRGKRIGFVRGFNLNGKLLDLILLRNGIDPAQVQRVNLRSADVRAAGSDGRVDVIFAVGPPAGNFTSALYQDFVSASGELPLIVPVNDAEAIAQRNPLLDSVTILRGTFGGSPPRPAESTESIGITHRLVADRSIKDSVISELTKSLFEIRQAISVDSPVGARIEAPNTEAPGPLVIHPGAAAYFDGEQKTFIEQYGEWIYLGVMGFGLLGSLGAAMLSRKPRLGRPSGAGDIDRMLLLLRRTRTASGIDALDQIQKEADDALAHIMEKAATSTIDEPVLSAFTIALGELRTAIEDRKRSLSHEQIAGLAE